MTPLDWIIAAILLLAILQGLREGLIVAAISLVSLVAGVIVAGRYWWVALGAVKVFVHTLWLAELISFFLVALLTMVGLTLVARLLRRAVNAIGLGWLDRLLGGAFGLLRGGLLVVLGFIIVAAFLPSVSWTKGSRFAPFFLSAAQTITRCAPSAAANKVFYGLQQYHQ